MIVWIIQVLAYYDMHIIAVFMVATEREIYVSIDAVGTSKW